jgi:hypothetical protein
MIKTMKMSKLYKSIAELNSSIDNNLLLGNVIILEKIAHLSNELLRLDLIKDTEARDELAASCTILQQFATGERK